MRNKKRKQWILLGADLTIVLLAASLVTYARTPVATAAGVTAAGAKPPYWMNAAAAAVPNKPTAELCLGCHGPVDKLKARTAGYVTDQNEKVNPHVNVPHDSTKFTTCTECHEAHPLPVTGPVKVAKATVQYCYAACHHINDFTPCAQCHKEKK